MSATTGGSDFLIVVDSREQRPWTFTGPTTTGTLQVGDYSVFGAEDMIAVERKSGVDLAGSLTRGRERFERELARARALQFFRVIVECSLSAFVKGDYHGRVSAANPKALFESVSALSVRFNTAFLFCDTPTLAAKLCESLLSKWLYEHRRWIAAVERAARKAVAA